MKHINWGIIGCGDVTEIKSGPAFNLIPGSSLHAVMRRNADKAADYAKRHGVSTWYSDASQLINDPQVNAVYVATPPDTHAKYTIEALNAGKPVYVEKPMALNPEECEAMLKASAENRVPLYTAYYRRALPGFLKVKELLENGEIGKPYSVNIKLHKAANNDSETLPWRLNPEIAGAGLFFDLAAHQLDYLDFLFGPVKQVHGIAANVAGAYRAEDTVGAVMTFENGAVGTGSWCFSTSVHNEIDVVEIIGEKGSIGFSSFEFVPVSLSNGNGVQYFDYEKPVHVQQNLIERVVKDLQGTDTSPSTGETAYRTNLVMHEILRSYYIN